MRSQNEPYYSLLNRSGRLDIRWGIRHRFGLALLQEILSDTWFSIKFKAGK